MLKTNIYASGINNLSDARYFAAFAVSYLGYPIDGTLSSLQINEMIEWVEGPLAVGEIIGLDSSPEIIDTLMECSFEAVVTSPYFKGYLPPETSIWSSSIISEDQLNLEDYSVLKVETPFQLMDESEMNKIQRLCTRLKLWLDIPFNQKNVDRLLSTFKPHGLVIKGGDEERPGIRSFDELDEIFDALYIEQ